MTNIWRVGGMTLTGKIEVLGEKSVPVPLFPQKIPHGLADEWTRPTLWWKPATTRLSNGMANMYRRWKEVMMKDDLGVVWNEEVEACSRIREKSHEICHNDRCPDRDSNHTLSRTQFQSVTCTLITLVARAVLNIKLLDLNLLLLGFLYRALYFGRSCFFFF